ncbi:DUF6169 family protein [Dyadobacter sp.]|uniref:DUF6169 family protein n=1 Tax=Dyadobacter sp. TaxID=1914288 RepID=UPI003F71F371
MLDVYPHELVEKSGKHIVYQFTSDKRGDYVDRFSKATYYFNIDCVPCEHMHEVAFFPVSPGVGFDKKIQNTLTNLIEEFMTEYNCPLLYVCDSIDGLEKCRLGLFERWVKVAKKSGKLFQHDYREIEWLDSQIILGILTLPGDTNFNNYFTQIGVE